MMSIKMVVATILGIGILLLVTIYGLFAHTISYPFRRWLRCEFYKTCPHYTSESYTCEHGGGNYCGTWRMLKYRP